MGFYLLFLSTNINKYFLVSFSLWQLRITVWSLCTKSVSYIKYPKACQQGKCHKSNTGMVCFNTAERGEWIWWVITKRVFWSRLWHPPCWGVSLPLGVHISAIRTCLPPAARPLWMAQLWGCRILPVHEGLHLICVPVLQIRTFLLCLPRKGPLRHEIKLGALVMKNTNPKWLLSSFTHEQMRKVMSGLSSHMVVVSSFLPEACVL